MENIKKVVSVLENDFEEAQDILDLSSYTSNVDAEFMYNERVNDYFNFTYSVKIEREMDYNRLLYMIRKEVLYGLEYEMKALIKAWKNEEIDEKKYREMKEQAERNHEKRQKFDKILLSEWKSGRLKSGQKLGRALKKAGFSNKLLDFYSLQEKKDREIFVTVTDKAQYIAGMSYYGQGWSSCQNTANESEYNTALAGSLHDDKLYIAFIHESIDDLQDMHGKMIGRTILRLVTINDFEILVATDYYGTNEGRDLMHKALEMLEGVEDVYSKNAHGSDYHRENTNGYAEVFTTKSIHVHRDETHYVEADCPVCDGHGTIDIYDYDDNEHTIDCLHCHGDGTIEVEEVVYIDEWVDVDGQIEVLPYDEGYDHNGYSIDFYLDKDYIINNIMEKIELETIAEKNL